MVEIEYIFRHDIEELVRLSYEGDNELFEKYHMEENIDFEKAVELCLYTIDDTARTVDFDYFKVLSDGKPIGYFCTFPKCLYSFAIAMEYRTKEVLIGLFEKIRSILGDLFACILYKNNTRAINWLLRCNCKQFETDLADNSVSLVYNNIN